MFQLGIISSDYIGTPVLKPDDYESLELLKSSAKIGLAVLFIDPSKIIIELLDKEIAIFYSHKMSNGEETLICLADLPAILVKRTRGFSEQIYDTIFLLAQQCPTTTIYDPPEAFQRPLSKIESFQKRLGKFNQPRSLILPAAYFPQHFPLEFPIIAKPTHGWRGYGVEECKNQTELTHYFQNFNKDNDSYGIILQEKIQTRDEYRVFVINGEAKDAVYKSNNSGLANNAAQGARFTKRKIKDLDKIKEVAEKCAIEQGLTFAGVDISIHDKKPYIIECNRNPEFKAFDKATKLQIADHIIKFIVEDSHLSTKEEPLSEDDLYAEAGRRLYGDIIPTKAEFENGTTLSKEFVAFKGMVEAELGDLQLDMQELYRALRTDIATGKPPSQISGMGPKVTSWFGGVVSKTMGKGLPVATDIIERIGELLLGKFGAIE